MLMLFKSPQRLAWITVIGAFMVFCLLCYGGVRLAQWVLFDLPMDLDTQVYVSRGTMGVASASDGNEIVVRNKYILNSNDRVRTDSQSQGHITFRNPVDDNMILATVHLRADSQVTLEHAERPRLGLGDNPYTIRLIKARGRFEVNIAAQIDRDFILEISGEGHTVRIQQTGYYIIEFGVESVTVWTRRGEALMINAQNRATAVTAGKQAMWDTENNLVIGVPSQDLIANSQFEEGQATIPLGWGCDLGEQDRPDDPPGKRERIYFYDRYSLHIWRSSNLQLFEARTGCERRNIDVSGYASLRLRATFYLVSQSLSGCGLAGTECPLILLMTYTDSLGRSHQWLQGFYIFWNQGIGRIRCDYCERDHAQVNAGAWYIFESEDFILDLPVDSADQRPYRIDQIRFYSSGHEYEVYVGELSLLGVPYSN